MPHVFPTPSHLSFPRPAAGRDRAQAGGITILVALMMLVFLTLTAVGMCRNSFREVIISGTTRQGFEVRDAADSGMAWSIFWQDSQNQASATGTALNLTTLMASLRQNDTLSGIPFDPNINPANPNANYPYNPANPPKPPTDLTFPAPAPGSTLGLSVALTRMGKLPITDMSQGAGTGAFTPAAGSETKQAPDLWAVRSDAQLTVGSGLGKTVFRHSKECWTSTPVAN
jgi:hypothetical protein